MGTGKQNAFELADLIWLIGFRLTAYIGRATKKETVLDWLRNGLPLELEPRMRTAYDVVLPIAETENEYAVQSFLWGNLSAEPTPESPATMLRDGDVETMRVVLMARARKEYPDNSVDNLEDVERRLRAWIEQNKAKLPQQALYKVKLHQDSLVVALLDFGTDEQSSQMEEQQRKWAYGHEWPLWQELIANVPEMENARFNIDLRLGEPFRYLDRPGKRRGHLSLYAGKKEWLQKIKQKAKHGYEME